jgi:hypothetical protein
MRDASAKVRLRRVADRQWGRVGSTQLAAIGIDRRTVFRWVEDGYLFHVHPRVYGVGHRAPSVEADHSAAVLYAGPARC